MARNKVRGGYQPLDLAELCTPLHWDETAPAALTGTALPLSARIKRKQLPYYHAIAVVRPLTPALAALVLADAAARGYQEAGLLILRMKPMQADAEAALPARRLVTFKKRNPQPGNNFILEYDLAKLSHRFMSAAQSLAQREEEGRSKEQAPIRIALPEPNNPFPGYSPLTLGAEDRITLVVFRPALSPGAQLGGRLSMFRLKLPEPLMQRQAVILQSLQDWLEHLYYVHQQLIVLARTGNKVKPRHSEFSSLISSAFKIWQKNPTMSSGDLYNKLSPDTEVLPSVDAVAKWLEKFRLGWIPSPAPVPVGTTTPVTAAALVCSEQASDPGPQWRAHHILARYLGMGMTQGQTDPDLQPSFRYALRPLRRPPEESEDIKPICPEEDA